MYSIKPKVYGNPDRGQDPNRPPYGVKPITLKSETLTALVERVEDWQIENDIGGGNWALSPVFKDGEHIGFMSYNGRVWVEKNLTEEVL